jgi:hypothetical protein
MTYTPTPLAVAFERFHADNPHVYETLVRYAREWRAQTGRTKLGIAMLVERARWDLAIATRSEDYKIANAHRAFYSRLIQWQESDLDGMFDIAASEANDWIWDRIERDSRTSPPASRLRP